MSTGFNYSFPAFIFLAQDYSGNIIVTDFHSGNLLRIQQYVPEILAGPLGQNVVRSNRVDLTIQATGSLPFNYQWQRMGTNLPGATSSALTLDKVTTNQAGFYRVNVQNTAGWASAAAQLTVDKWAPVWLTGLRTETNRQLRMLLTGPEAVNFAIDSSTNMVEWKEWQRGATTNGLWEIIDPEAGKYPRRFFRARQTN